MRWLAAFALLPLAAGADGYMKCYLDSDRSGPATCYLPLVNATYACILSPEGPRCETARQEPVTCYSTSAEVYCIPGATIRDEPAHVTITGFAPSPPSPPPRVAAPPRRIVRAPRAEDPPRQIPTIGDLMRGPPRPTPAEEALMDAADAAAEAAENAAKAAASTGAAVRDLGIQQREARERAQRGISCRWLGNTLFCDP